jgi:hypothetical protein
LPLASFHQKNLFMETLKDAATAMLKIYDHVSKID